MSQRMDVLMKYTIYSRLIEHLSQQDTDLAPYLEKIMSENHKLPWLAMAYKSETLSDAEREVASGYLSLGFFKNLEENERLACFNMVLVAEYTRELNRQKGACTQYDGSEAIFESNELRDRRNKDLIEGMVGERGYGSNIFKLGNKWGYYDSRIPLQIYDWLEDCFKDNKKRIRVDPKGLYDNKPAPMVVECQIYPANWQWWKQLKVYKGCSTGSSFVLLGNDPHQHGDYYDYNVLHVRGLQEVVKRYNDGNLRMTLEELSEFNHPTDGNKRYVIGRMIHLDTDAQVDTSFEDAILNHIDLAYNLYVDDDANKRLDQHLRDGDTVQNATHRTHILRIEGIPFPSIFKLAHSFFKSRTLTDEWIEKEFQ